MDKELLNKIEQRIDECFSKKLLHVASTWQTIYNKISENEKLDEFEQLMLKVLTKENKGEIVLD